MAKKRKSRELEDVPALPLTPMIDCTFLLLIFFMLASRFKSTEGKLKAFLPKDRGQSASTPTIDLGEMRVKLLWCHPGSKREFRKRVVGEGFKAYYGTVSHGQVVLKVKERYFSTVSSGDGNIWPNYVELLNYINDAKRAYSPPRSDPSKEMPVIIDAREAVPWKHVVMCLNAAMSAGLTDISFAAPEIVY